MKAEKQFKITREGKTILEGGEKTIRKCWKELKENKFSIAFFEPSNGEGWEIKEIK